ncbi:MAG: PrgI family protein [bacterium]|nr:PrgI family protein [bacterium]
MSVYKVPQDVEADDKLLGPFNFRQFIYLMIAAGLGLVGFFFWQIFPALIIIPAPFIIFLVVLALPIKKDQPMELYLAAVLSFYIKPPKRIWQADGIEHLIEISAPVREENILTKDISRDEASRRLSYLADIVDTEGWAIRNAVAQDTNLHEDIVSESNQVDDIFENRGADRIDSMLSSHKEFRKQEIMRNINTARNLADYTNSNAEQIQSQTFAAPKPIDLYSDAQQRSQINQSNFLSWNNSREAQSTNPAQPAAPQNPNTPQNQVQNISQPPANQATPTPPHTISHFRNPEEKFENNSSEFENVRLEFNPYPDSIRQTVILPNSQKPASNPPAPAAHSENISPEIMRLVSEGKDLSVETIARQANKIRQRQDNVDLNNEEEVVISLR